MSFQVPQVFISSTSEFAAERKELERAIASIPDFSFKAFIYEEESARSESPEKHCRAMLDASEIVVLILGTKYGTPFPGKPMSIVEWEYEYARDRNKELKGYVRQTLPDTPVDPQQAAFVDRVRAFRSGTWCRIFSAPSDLLAWVVHDVKQWRLDSWKRFTETSTERRRWRDRVVLGSAAAVAVATLGGVVAGAFLGVPMEKLALILVSGLLIFGALGWLLKSDVI